MVVARVEIVPTENSAALDLGPEQLDVLGDMGVVVVAVEVGEVQRCLVAPGVLRAAADEQAGSCAKRLDPALCLRHHGIHVERLHHGEVEHAAIEVFLGRQASPGIDAHQPCAIPMGEQMLGVLAAVGADLDAIPGQPVLIEPSREPVPIDELAQWGHLRPFSTSSITACLDSRGRYLWQAP